MVLYWMLWDFVSMQVSMCISFVAFSIFFFILWCRDAMNSLATVTMEHFDSWLCLDASPSGQCMPGIRWWAVWDRDVTEGGGLRTEQRQYMPDIYVTMFRAEPEMFCWYKIWERPTLTLTSEKQSSYQFVSSFEEQWIIWPVINCHLVMCQIYCSYLQLKYFSMLKYSYSLMRGRYDYM